MPNENSQIYGRGYGKLWPALLEDHRLDAKARLCFGVMGSFGPTRRAGLKSIARRMGLKSTDSVRDAQRLLQKTGWLVLLIEGYAEYPRVWWLNDRVNDHDKNEDVAKEMKEVIAAELLRREEERDRKKHHPSGVTGIGKKRPPKKGDPLKHHPKQELDLSSKGSAKQETTPPADAGEGAASKTPMEQVRTHFAALYLKHHGEAMTEPGRELLKLEEKLLGQHGQAKLCTRALNYFADHTRSNHPYMTWLTRNDDWAKPRLKLGAPKEDDQPKRGRSAAAELAHAWGLEVKDDAS